jgi:Spy/CpxP family protein refolding chaperone
VKTSRILFAALVAAVAFPALALAQADIPDGKWWKRPRLAAEINLSPEQSREIENIFVRTRPRLIDLRADLEKKQLALQVSMEDKAVDRHHVEKEIEAVENARAELQKARALMILDMKQVLRQEQWERLLQMQQNVRERRQMMRERMEEQLAEPDRPRRNLSPPPNPEKPKPPPPEKKNKAG